MGQGHNLAKGSELRGQAWSGHRAATCHWSRRWSWNVWGQDGSSQGGGRASDTGQGKELGGLGEKAGLDLKNAGGLKRKDGAWQGVDKG